MNWHKRLNQWLATITMILGIILMGGLLYALISIGKGLSEVEPSEPQPPPSIENPLPYPGPEYSE